MARIKTTAAAEKGARLIALDVQLRDEDRQFLGKRTGALTYRLERRIIGGGVHGCPGVCETFGGEYSISLAGPPAQPMPVPRARPEIGAVAPASRRSGRGSAPAYAAPPP